MRFRDRGDAGRRLADHLADLHLREPVVVGVPRGGVPVAREVARVLAAPLDVAVVCKVALEQPPELGVGAVGELGVSVHNGPLLAALRITDEDVAASAGDARREVDRRVARFRHGEPPRTVADRTVVLVDDGVVTGVTMRAAIEVLRVRGAGTIVVATPVASRRVLGEIRVVADRVVCLHEVPTAFGVQSWYEHFEQVSDTDVAASLARSPGEDPATGDAPRLDVDLPVDGVVLPAVVAMPADAAGLAVVCHAGGRSRAVWRSRATARALSTAGCATLLVDLLTPREARCIGDIRGEQLGRRLNEVAGWVRDRPALAGLPLALVGDGRAGTASLMAAADLAEQVSAVVSRGGRPDLAAHRLEAILAPTLLLVEGADTRLLDLTEWAAARLTSEHELTVLPGASRPGREGRRRAEIAIAEWIGAHLQPSRVPH